jgi:hypothetical protein
MKRVTLIGLLAVALLAVTFAGNGLSAQSKPAAVRDLSSMMQTAYQSQQWDEGKAMGRIPTAVPMSFISNHMRHAMGHAAHRSVGGLHLMGASMCDGCNGYWAGEFCAAPGATARCFYRTYNGGTTCCNCQCIGSGYFGKWVCV